MIPEALVYVLCAATSLLCTILLGRGWRQSGSRLLFWCALCFACFTINNVILFFDLIIWRGPDVDLSIPRNAVGLLGATLLLFGMIWEREDR